MQSQVRNGETIRTWEARDFPILKASIGVEDSGLKTSPKLGQVHAALREQVATLDVDRIMAGDIARAHDFLHRHPFLDLVGGLLARAWEPR